MANKTVFALATVMLVLSFLVSHFERFFFTLNFLESLIYLAILLLLFYGLEEWAYAVGIAAPVFWMALAWAGGLLGGSLGEFARTVSGGGVQSPTRFLGILVFVGAMLLFLACAHAFRRDVWGTQGALRVLLGGVLAVGLYYALLTYIYLNMARPAGDIPAS